MNIKQITSFIFIMCCSITIHAAAFNNKLDTTIIQLSSALQKKDIESLKQVISKDFSISTVSGTSAESTLAMLLDKLNIRGIELVENHSSYKNNQLVKAKLNLEKEGVKETILALDSLNKVLYIDYFDRLFGHSRFAKSRLVASLPFYTKGKSIILKARLNDKKREISFLFDTGANGMAIRTSLADSLGLQNSHSQNADVVGGQMKINISSENTLHLSDSLSLKNQRIAIFENLSSAEGIIGLNLIKQYITEIDFENKTINLYTFGDLNYEQESTTLPLKTDSGLMLVDGQVNLVNKKSVSGNFIIDTGADYHLILFSRFVRKNRLLLTGFKAEGEGSTVSLGVHTPVFYGKTYQFSLGENIKQNNMPITLQASLGKDNTNPDSPDGSIGIQFFSNYKLTINLLDKELNLQSYKK